MIIQHNIMALNSYNKLATNNSAVQKNLEKLSSGYRINRAGDDAAGLAISEKMRAQITGLERAKLNAQDGISLVQTAEGALTEVHSMLNRLVELGTESANGIYQAEDREKIQAEVNQIGEEIDRISKATNFNGIKLLDGSLAKTVNDSVDLKTGGVDFSDGMEITNTAGQGAQSEFSLEINGTFGEGDTITINYNVPGPNGTDNFKSVTLTYQDAPISDAQYGHTAAAGDNLLTFTGDTKEAQMESIMKRLSGKNTHADMAAFNPNTGNVFETQQVNPTDGKYTIGVDGNKLTIKANDEGYTGQLAIRSVTTNNVDAGLTTSITTSGAHNTAKNNTEKNYYNYLVTSGANIQAGDTLNFTFDLTNGTTADVNLKVTDDMISSDHTIMTKNIVEALKNAKFTDDDATAIDESQFKVSDFFVLEANKGWDGAAEEAQIGSISFQRTAAALNSATAASSFKLTALTRTTAGGVTDNLGLGGSAANAPVLTNNNDMTMDATKDAVEVKKAALDRNLTIGDKYVMEGTLTDGRKFKIELKVGDADDYANNTIAKGASKDATLANILKALNGTGLAATDPKIQAQISNAAGDDLGTMDTDKMFGATGATGITITQGANADNDKLVFTQNVAGAGRKLVNGSINDPTIVPQEAAKASGVQVTKGVDQGSAVSTIDFNDKSKLEYGTTITIGSKQFELVAGADSELSEAGNIRVIIQNLENLGTTGEDVANAFANAINKELTDNDGNITDYAAELGLASADDVGTKAVTVDPDPAVAPPQPARNLNLATVEAGTGKVTLKSIAEGGDVAKVDVKDTYGNKENTTLSVAENTDGSLKLKAGDTVIINGKTYQFDTDVRNAKEGNSVIKVDDFSSKESIAKAIKTALNADDPTVDVKINDDFSVTFSGSGKNTAPKVELGLDKGGLTLQIGDTADDYNKVTVSVSDMSTKGLGIDNLQVTDQGLAAESIDKVKGAIERVSVTRGNLGALQNRLEHTINNLATTTENMTAAESRIRDTDMAKEMMHFTKNNVLVQAAQAMLAQANQQPQQVLQLLR